MKVDKENKTGADGVLTGWSVYQLMERYQLVGVSAGRCISWSVYQLVGVSAGRCISWSGYWPVGSEVSVEPGMNPDDPS